MVAPRTQTALRYYLYVSDAKLDMIYEQIPTRLRKRLAAELKIDLKLVSVSLKQAPREQTRFSKLALVSEYVGENLRVGGVREPAEWFRGRARLSWGQVPGRDAVYFGGVSEGTALGLIGSLRHVLGESPVGSEYNESFFRAHLTLRWMAGLFARDGAPLGRGSPMSIVETAASDFSGNASEIEFLARTLDQAGGGDWLARHRPWEPPVDRVLLGTPLYVALSEEVEYDPYLPPIAEVPVRAPLTAAQAPLSEVIVHYHRPDGDYQDAEGVPWTMHLWGDGLADGAATDWNAPQLADGADDYGIFFRVPLRDQEEHVGFIVHLADRDREPGGDRHLYPLAEPEVWLRQGDPRIYVERPRS